MMIRFMTGRHEIARILCDDAEIDGRGVQKATAGLSPDDAGQIGCIGATCEGISPAARASNCAEWIGDMTTQATGAAVQRSDFSCKSTSSFWQRLTDGWVLRWRELV